MSLQNYLAEAKICSSNQHNYTMAVRLNDATCTKS